MELVSVIIPTYNAEASLPRALKSVQAQSYGKIEIILVDDGSADNTVEVARAMLAEIWPETGRLIARGRNGGPSAARNEALRVARGSWVQFLDADDLLAPSKLERQMAVAEQCGGDVVAVHSPWMMGSAHPGGTQWRGHLCDPRIEDRAPVTCFLPPVRPLLAASLVRRTTLAQTGGFNESLRFWECEEVCYKLSLAGRFLSLSSEEPLYLWSMPDGKDYIGDSSAKYDSTPVGVGWIDRILEATGGGSLEQLHLSAEDEGLVLDECTHWARHIYGSDREVFARYMANVRILAPSFRPTRPWALAWASRFLSYERAEALAAAVRGLRRAPRPERGTPLSL